MKAYPSAEKCVYCGVSDGPLSKEHIIPYSLGGNLVLRKASCSTHAALTSAFEADFSRVAYGYYRAENNVRSRKPHKLAQLLKATVALEGETFDGSKVIVNVPVSEAPPVPVVLRLPEPGILAGRSRSADGECQVEFPPTHDPKLRELREKKGLARLTSAVTTVPITQMLRTLAKIAHVYATAELGSEGFNPALLDTILESGAPGAYYLIGEHNPPLPQSDQELILRNVKIGDDTWIVVDISLRFLSRIPRYQVFAGTARV